MVPVWVLIRSSKQQPNIFSIPRDIESFYQVAPMHTTSPDWQSMLSYIRGILQWRDVNILQAYFL